MLQISEAEALLVTGGLDEPISPEQYDVTNQVINAGIALGYGAQDIEVALNVAYIESRLGANTGNQDAVGVFQYQSATWTDNHPLLER